ncbi:hypothetical protein [Desulfosporosinus sp. HMP52]|nr:hypothetical protein [Desulfosporosinus sp. HMP52]
MDLKTTYLSYPEKLAAALSDSIVELIGEQWSYSTFDDNLTII